MKQRVADYIADFLAEHGVNHVFTVVGGGAMHLNDALGHHDKIKCIYNHHEQASAMAAEGYARVNNKIALVCVTTGPGATNAITGVAGAWMDSIPMLVISGQARYATTVAASGLNLRTRGIQEFDIIGSVYNMTKYCVLVKEATKIKYELEKALYFAKSGRPGPCWIDIPLDIQGAIVETDDMESFALPCIKEAFSNQVVESVLEHLKLAKRPLIFAGNGIRLADANNDFREFVSKTGIPVISGMGSVDAVESEHFCYVGREGITGSRAANFALQNCDVLLSLGSRQSYFQTGFDVKAWAPFAYKILNDIDADELKKFGTLIDMPLCGNVKELLKKLNFKLLENTLPDYTSWRSWCIDMKQCYPVIQEKHYQSKSVNIYAFYYEMSKLLDAETQVVASVGTSRVVGSQVIELKKGQRFYTNPSMAAMGFDLPAAIGVCIGSQKKTVLVTGDGSLQMNLQEFQTIAHHKFPIIVFVMNNQGYHSIRMTQNNYFNPPLVGVGEESGDLDFPNLKKIITSYGIPYYSIHNMQELASDIRNVLMNKGPLVCEVFLDVSQNTEPKVISQRLKDGQMKSAALENMAPFLSSDELNLIMKTGRKIGE